MLLAGVSEDETTGPSWVIGIVFENLSVQQDFFDLRDGNSIHLPFVFGVAAELITS
jgi:hypothetical protein